jgi:DNA-binding MarR family transcriptional regulator
VNNRIQDTEYAILEEVYNSSEHHRSLRQRDMAQTAGASLGMTNVILKRLTKKGWIAIKKLNSRNIQYAITLDGMNEIIHRSYHYFKRTIKNVVFYRESIDKAIQQAKQRGVTTVILVGVSDLDFILEHSCHRHGLSFLKTVSVISKQKNLGDTLTVYAETIPLSRDMTSNTSLYLSRMVLNALP